MEIAISGLKFSATDVSDVCNTKAYTQSLHFGISQNFVKNNAYIVRITHNAWRTIDTHISSSGPALVFLPYLQTLEMKASGSFESSVTYYQVSRRCV